jgi:hypothetical protein
MEAHDQKFQALRSRQAQQQNLKSLIRSAPHRGDFAHHFIFLFYELVGPASCPLVYVKAQPEDIRRLSAQIQIHAHTLMLQLLPTLLAHCPLRRPLAHKILLLIDHDLRRSHPLPFLTLETKAYDFL